MVTIIKTEIHGTRHLKSQPSHSQSHQFTREHNRYIVGTMSYVTAASQGYGIGRYTLYRLVMIKPKENCSCCLKNINIGQAITECNKCSYAIHTKCYKNSKFSKINEHYYCSQSRQDSIELKYNPFKIRFQILAMSPRMKILLNLLNFIKLHPC